ncbi:PfkB family carbohydrate kinase [Tateyamaria sp. syn59]|uniref:PfkB family carbohydrate kinase n=1 Tax=Tateyamaria sp. syn59 TaxID=2576942 RepID=UPI0011BED342|nr:PfkB family carbohydrate kinase [Tateyamaria sp. syn59]
MSVFVVGSLHLDVVLRAPHLPQLDETVAGSAVDFVFGGKGGNQAVAAARMGADVGLAGRIGSDPFGDMIRTALDAARINTGQLQVDNGASGMSAAIVEDSGQYGAVIVSAANLRINAEQIAIPPSTSLLLLQNEVPDAVNLSVARKAREAGVQVWLNAAPARALPVELLDQIDLLIVNRVEAAFYAGVLAAQPVLTTLGADGARYDGINHPAYKVDVVSAHGAGDMFVGALAARVADGDDIPDAIGFAQAAAALHVTQPLAERDMLTADKVRAFMAGQARP